MDNIEKRINERGWTAKELKTFEEVLGIKLPTHYINTILTKPNKPSKNPPPIPYTRTEYQTN